MGGVYSNSMLVMHTQNEFILDFLAVVPPQATVNSRVIVRPETLKRMIAALKDNMDKFEARFGEVASKKPDGEDVGGYS